MKVKFFGEHNLSLLGDDINNFVEMHGVTLLDVKYQISADGEWYTALIMYK